ncbi:MAG: tetratricopeptide repeat protein, partial [Candidatus Omnitrophica bacterium]|nr:tetratricopeptide repeat protein [Candidatus Omnitrophota bacterium]
MTLAADGREGKCKKDLAALKEKVKNDPFYIRTLERRANFKSIEELDDMTNLAEKQFVLFQKAVNTKPSIVEPVVNLAEVYNKLGLFDKAVHYFSLSIRRHPEYMKARYGLARLCADLGFDKKAVSEYEEILRLERANLAAYARVICQYDSIIEKRKKDGEDASIYVEARKVPYTYLKGLTLKGLSEKINNYALGLAWEKIGNFEEAIIAYQKDLRKNPKDSLTLLALGNVYLKEQQYDEAIQFCKKVIMVQPQNKEAYFNLGVAYSNLHQYANAIENYKNRNRSKVNIPKEKMALVAGFTMENIFYNLGGSFRPSYRPLNDAI